MNNKIKILHIDYDDLANSFGAGGQAVVTRELYKALNDMFIVTAFTGNYPGAKNLVIDGIHYQRVGIGNMGSYISLLSFQIMIPFIILHMQRKFDVIVEFFTAPFSASFGFVTAKKPHLVVQTFLGARELSKKYHLPFFAIENFVLKRIRNFLVPTKEIQQRIKTINPSASITILPYGYDHHLREVVANEEDYILYMGRIDLYNKGLDILLQAWAIISKIYPEIQLYIAGSGKSFDEHKLHMLIIKYDLENNIKKKGRVVGEEKISLLANCLFTVIPSRFETFCISALESLAIGKAMIRSDISGMSWIPENCSLVFKTGDINSLAGACIEYLRNKKLRRDKGKNAKKFSEKYSWDKIAGDYKKVITKFLRIKKSE